MRVDFRRLVLVAVLCCSPAVAWSQEMGGQSLDVLKEQLRNEILQQRNAWQTLERSQHPTLLPPNDMEPRTVRSAHSFCNGGPFYVTMQDKLAQRGYERPTQILSSAGPFGTSGVCPWWVPPKVSGRMGRTHEYTGHNPTPAQLRPFSEALTVQLERAAAASTDDIWPLSQLVRVLTENEQFDRARRALHTCALDEGWCALLRLHVEQESGNYVAADSLVRLMLRYTPADAYRLLQAGGLLLRDDAMRYQDITHDSVTAAIWWLAQPFFSDSANARRSEHLSRLVRNTLAQQLDIDVFYHTAFASGYDARQLMRQRYGWPSHHAWMGKAAEDRLTTGWRTFPPPPYSAPEYAWPRSATLPRLRAALDPLSATDDDFSLGPPDSVSHFRWWPAEFFQHKHGLIVSFPSQQRVMLRRDSSMRIVIATRLAGAGRPSLLDSIGDTPVRGELWLSPAPDSATRLHYTMARSGGHLVLHGEVRQPGIIGAEFRVNANGLAGGRTRFGVKDIRTLSALPAGACELSVPMLVAPEALGNMQQVAVEQALLGSLTLDQPTRLGLAWESYGVRPGDTTTVAVQIERQVDVGRLRRAGIALGVAQDPGVSAGIRWTEPDPSRSTTIVPSAVPVMQRQLMLGIEPLKAGEYLLQIEMQNTACGTVRSEQTFHIRR